MRHVIITTALLLLLVQAATAQSESVDPVWFESEDTAPYYDSASAYWNLHFLPGSWRWGFDVEHDEYWAVSDATNLEGAHVEDLWFSFYSGVCVWEGFEVVARAGSARTLIREPGEGTSTRYGWGYTYGTDLRWASRVPFLPRWLQPELLISYRDWFGGREDAFDGDELQNRFARADLRLWIEPIGSIIPYEPGFHLNLYIGVGYHHHWGALRVSEGNWLEYTSEGNTEGEVWGDIDLVWGGTISFGRWFALTTNFRYPGILSVMVSLEIYQ